MRVFRLMARGWARWRSLFTRRADEQRLREEFDAHVTMATDEYRRAGYTDDEARRRAEAEFGGMAAMRELYREQRGLPRLESLVADAVYGWRQLHKHRTASAVAVLSLALATGACLATFRVMDALLWRPLPVAAPEELAALSRVGAGFDGKVYDFDSWAYPSFLRMRERVRDEAELVAVSPSSRMDIFLTGAADMEKASVQYVSGALFSSFQLRPAAGRLLTASDDERPGAHPYAVLSHEYWTRRFGARREVVGQSFQMRDQVYTILGVGPAGFTGTEPGVANDIFVPATMHVAAVRDDSTWHRILARVRPGANPERLRQELQASDIGFERERAKSFQSMRQEAIDRYLQRTVVLTPAGAGASSLQRGYRRPLVMLGLLVALVLLIVCANLANLLTAQAAARTREMALRISIGAGRWRLVRMVLVESLILGLLASGLGLLFAWRTAPYVVSQLNPPDNPAYLAMPMDVRVMGFAVLLTVLVTLLFGMAPALRASAVDPMRALRGGANPKAWQRTMHVLIGVQVAFCFVVLFVSGLFAATFERLAQKPLGFAAEGVVALEIVAEQGQSPVVWEQVAGQLRAMPGVESVAMASWPLLAGRATNNFIAVGAAPPGPVLAYFLDVSPGWLGTMGIPILAGRDFREEETTPGSAIVNEAFARQFFSGEAPVGKWFVCRGARYEVTGVAKDAPYRSLRDPILPVAYTPFRQVRGTGVLAPLRERTLVVRTAKGDPLLLAGALRREIGRLRPDFRVSNVRSQMDLVRAQTLQERLIAMIALFFAGIAALLSGLGLYGVLDYTVLQRRWEIGIRMALGAPWMGIAGMAIRETAVVVALGAMAGVAGGMGAGRYVETLLFEVDATEWGRLVYPAGGILLIGVAAAVAPVLRAIRVDPMAMLRTE